MTGELGPSASPATRPAAPTSQGWIRRISGYAWRYRRNVLLAFGAALLGTLVAAATPLVERQVIDRVVVARDASVTPYAITLVLFGLLRFGFSFVRRFIGGRLALDVQYDLRDDVFRSLQRLDGAGQDQTATGQVVSRASSDITLVQGLLAFLPNISGNVLMFVVSLLVMLVLSPLLTIVTVLVGPALFLVARGSRNALFPATWDAQQRAGEVAGVVEEDVSGVRVVKGFGQEAREVARLEGVARELYASRIRAVDLTSRFQPALSAIPTLGTLGVLGFGGYLTIHGSITLGTFLAFSTYLTELVSPVRILAALLTTGQQARAGATRVLELIDSQPEVQESADAIDLQEVRGEVVFDDVTFGYRRSTPVLRGVSVRIDPGETVAFVGGPGSGKSTIAMLLSRFYDVQDGRVLLDGHDVRTLTLASLRSRTGVVFEDSFLFSDSVFRNIAYGRPGATTAEVEAAARAAEADVFIRELPDGYDTVVGEQGLTLSGGQRQRVALARALITDPRVLVLDDATSAVDTTTEAEIHATLHRLMEGRTTLLIAHRRSTLRLADRIVVLDEGRVLDQGTHDELMDRCAQYRLLLSGPGLDAEGIDAGSVSDRVAGLNGTAQVGGITPALWPDITAGPMFSANGTLLSAAANSIGGRAATTGGGFGGGPMGGVMASMPATPELLARVAALPPATADPHVDIEQATEPDPGFALGRLLRPLRWMLVGGLVLVVLDALSGLVLPLLIRHGVNAGIGHRTTNVLWATCGLGVLVVLGDWLVSTVQVRLSGRTGERLLYSLRLKTFAQLQRLGMDYYERELTGRIMTRMTTDVDALSSFLQTGLTTAVVSLLQFAGVLIVLLVLDPALAGIVLAVMPVLAVATVLFRRKSSAAYTDAREKVSAVNASLQENMSGVRVTQAFNQQHGSTAEFRRVSDDYRQSRMKAQQYIATYFPFVEFLSEITAALVLSFGAASVHSGHLTTGTLIAFLLYLDLFFSPVQQLSQVFDGYQQALVGLHRLSDLLRTPTTVPPAPQPLFVDRMRGEVTFSDVYFRYASRSGPDGESRGVDALSGVTVRIEPGETVALVGQTGAGKSTMVKLVARFYDPTAGVVRADGQDLRDLDLASYRHRLGFVPQEAYLFRGTVRDAIAYGKPDATDAEVEAAARMVGAHEIVAGFSDGYRHDVGERGRSLSAGQRQLLALARAALVDPDILLLDEATASLDLATEAAVLSAMERLARRRTTLVIAHRLTTAERADRVVVVSGGRVAAVGTHAALLAEGGAYADLWSSFVGGGVWGAR
jgi:ATP-binding cassette subfamily B protein